MTGSDNKPLFYIFIVLSMVFWGASWVNVKFLTAYVDPYEMIFLRMGISFIMMFPLIYLFRYSFKIDFKTFILVLLAAGTLIVYSVVFFLGIDYGTPGFGGALVTTLIPINTYVIMAILNKRILSLKHSFALVLGGFGVLTMLNIWQFDLNEIFSKENIYFLISSILWPILTIISSKATKTNAMVFSFYVYIICFVVISLIYVDAPDLISKVLTFDYVFWLNLFMITALSTVFATTIYFFGIIKLGASEVSSFIFLVPASALVLSNIFLSEKIDFNTLLGVICTIIAIYILNNLNIFKLLPKSSRK